MNIRSVTCFVNAGSVDTQAEHRFDAAGQLAREASAALRVGGLSRPDQRVWRHNRFLTCQMTRCTWPPNFGVSAPRLALITCPWARSWPTRRLPICRVLDLIPDLIRSTETVFASVLVSKRGQGLHLEAIQRTASIVREIAHTTDLGFGNLRLAMLANVGPHSPFFPAAYHDGGPPALAIATESADLAVTAFSDATSLDEARLRLVAAVEAAAGQIVDLIGPLLEKQGYRFTGIDFSLAPFPEEARSIGAAVEAPGCGSFWRAGHSLCLLAPHRLPAPGQLSPLRL